MATKYDTIIIGGGVSGLVTARALQGAGKKILVLEARNRLGGRTWSKKLGKATFDYGGQWIGPTQLRVNRLVKELDIEIFPTYHKGLKVLDHRSRISTYKGTIPSLAPHKLILLQLAITRIDRLAKKVLKDEPWNSKKAAKLDSITVRSWQERNIPNREVRDLMNAALRVIFGSEADELSLLHVLHYVHCGGNLMTLVEIENGFQQDRIVGGMQQLSIKLGKIIGAKNIRLNQPVRRIEQKKNEVTVVTEKSKFTAKTVVFALAPGLANKMIFSPALPNLKKQLIQRVPMAATIKCFALYDKPFWREKGLSGEAASTTGPLTVCFDNSSFDSKQACLLGFVVGAQARTFSILPAEERKRVVLQQMANYFGPEVHNHQGYYEVDWSSEEYSDGCPIGTFPTGTMSVFGPQLRAPIGRLFWAGTETAREATGFIEGAIESGERVSTEVLDFL